MLLNKVVLGAVKNASLDASHQRIAILFSLGQALAAAVEQPEAETRMAQINLSESMAAKGQFSGPYLDLSIKGHPLAAGLFEAQQMLSTQVVEAVVIGAVALLEDFAGLLQNGTKKINSSGPLTLGFDRNVDGWNVGEGASALVLMRHEAALAAGKRIYAVIDAAAWVLKEGPELKKNIFATFLTSETILKSCQQAFSKAGVEPGQIGYLEVLGGGFTPVDAAEMAGITQAYRPAKSLTCAVGSIGANVGYLFNAAGVTALVKTALVLYHRCVFQTPQWMGPKKAELWNDTPFYVSNETHTWFLSEKTSRYLAAVNVIGWDGSCAHFILSEESCQPVRPNRFLAQSPFYLFPIAGNTLDELRDSLQNLHQTISVSSDLFSAAQHCFQSYLEKSATEYVVTIVGHDRDEIQREIEHGLKNLPVTWADKKIWQTPQGSFFTADPVGNKGEVAFVYPGAFNSYIGLGRDLFLLFPQLYEQITQLTTDLGYTIQDQRLYPRSLEALNKEQLAALETQLNAGPIAMITSGSLMAILFTMILKDVFKVQPAAAFGYSLGEIAMLFGSGVWTQADAIRASLNASPLFHSRLAGAQNAVRQFWGLPEIEVQTSGASLWCNYFLMAPAEKVLEAVALEERVYLTHINTPRQVVIAGDEIGCQRVIAALKCHALKAPFDFAMHCKAIRTEYNALIDLYTWPVAKTPQPRLYTAAGCQILTPNSSTIAHQMATMMCESINFPSLVHQVYADGARIFVELGANANCSKWIDDTLKGSAYLAVAINRRGADDQASLVRLLAKLVSHRVPLDLSPLYQSSFTM